MAADPPPRIFLRWANMCRYIWGKSGMYDSITPHMNKKYEKVKFKLFGISTLHSFVSRTYDWAQ